MNSVGVLRIGIPTLRVTLGLFALKSQFAHWLTGDLKLLKTFGSNDIDFSRFLGDSVVLQKERQELKKIYV